ncbi:hypothetical protein POVWA2_025280 [Plasmodium ovale wallikeri]|uniref:Uncharacterized protein n=1 Tax=Plasmodium ovale wallikeri TaxID=864142 RepID=A0A1A8YVL0_PLAOA|nr:hypothetical protein POVWA2_025280 [Plasmodium ovale wallikeri]
MYKKDGIEGQNGRKKKKKEKKNGEEDATEKTRIKTDVISLYEHFLRLFSKKGNVTVVQVENRICIRVFRSTIVYILFTPPFRCSENVWSSTNPISTFSWMEKMECLTIDKNNVSFSKTKKKKKKKKAKNVEAVEIPSVVKEFPCGMYPFERRKMGKLHYKYFFFFFFLFFFENKIEGSAKLHPAKLPVLCYFPEYSHLKMRKYVSQFLCLN